MLKKAMNLYGQNLGPHSRADHPERQRRIAIGHLRRLVGPTRQPGNILDNLGTAEGQPLWETRNNVFHRLMHRVGIAPNTKIILTIENALVKVQETNSRDKPFSKNY